ncbi:hypothetical protein REC12_13805 [Desulfosporosinus sp. PR]|uniref:hypothetical protein n=1 Tax=Candidatus Desulfosporosinus nitrosoreducens TaxID=3401928 RepID=UPI0027F94E12|nr:hypothetical protein [Desulfosporosinus sp. PR]MDQ7094666.1 hypothetical protein [Desulfosporosinus sp. PR]
MKYINKPLSIISIVIVSLIIVGCLSQSTIHNQSLKRENQALKDQVVGLEKNVEDYKTKELKERQKQLTIDFGTMPDYKVRFIENENKLLALPDDDSQVFRYIQKNTLAEVIDIGRVEDVSWLYIRIPTYDSLANNKGWIRENDTVPYAKDKVTLVQSDVTIKAGAEVYKTFNFDDIKKTTPVKLVAEDGGRLEEKVNGYCRISEAGGVSVWVKESSVMYPEI